MYAPLNITSMYICHSEVLKTHKINISEQGIIYITFPVLGNYEVLPRLLPLNETQLVVTALMVVTHSVPQMFQDVLDRSPIAAF